jgi:uncharacterized cupin superfamily protein
VANAHHVLDRGDVPCSYLIVGTRPSHDVCRYPDVGKTLHAPGPDLAHRRGRDRLRAALGARRTAGLMAVVLTM